MSEKDLEPGEVVLPKKIRPAKRKDRLMCREVADVRKLDQNDIVTFYMHADTVRYYVRLINPLAREGIAIFHLNKKGRPTYRLIPRYTIPKGTTVALLFRHELSSTILGLLRNNNPFTEEDNDE